MLGCQLVHPANSPVRYTFRAAAAGTLPVKPAAQEAEDLPAQVEYDHPLVGNQRAWLLSELAG